MTVRQNNKELQLEEQRLRFETAKLALDLLNSCDFMVRSQIEYSICLEEIDKYIVHNTLPLSKEKRSMSMVWSHPLD